MLSTAILAVVLAAPKIVAPETDYDFGVVEEGKPAVHIFKLQNVGDDTLVIDRVRSSCGCTAALLSEKQIPPGGEAEVKVTFNTTGRGGQTFHKTVSIYSNDPEQPKLVLHIRGKVKEMPKPKGWIKPGYLDLGTLQVGDTVQKTVFLHSTGQEPLVIREMVATSGVQIQPWTQDTVPPGDSVAIQFEVIPVMPGRFEGVLVVKTNDPTVPQKFLRLVGQVKEAER